MLQFEELRLRLEGLLPDIEDLAHAVGIKQMLAETEELDARAAADGFWDDMDAAQKVVQKTAILKAKIESHDPHRAGQRGGGCLAGGRMHRKRGTHRR